MESKAIQELSRKMLEGWTMLAECCPFCLNIPLAEHKRQKKILCVNCNKQYTRGDGGVFTLLDTSNSPSSSVSAIPTAEPAPVNKVKEIVDLDITGEYDFTPPTKEELERFDAKRKRQDGVSKIIGEKLLGGWAMLDLMCPNEECGTVLMRDKAKQMWCLACNTMVITEAEFDSTKHRLISEPQEKEKATEPSQETAPKNSNHQLQAQKQQVQRPQQQPLPLQFRQQPTQSRQPTQQPPQQQLFQSQQQRGSNLNPQPVAQADPEQAIVNYSMASLYNKLKSFSEILSQTTDPSQCVALCAAIKEISAAIANLQSLRR